jgi:hypothetical protein
MLECKGVDIDGWICGRENRGHEVWMSSKNMPISEKCSYRYGNEFSIKFILFFKGGIWFGVKAKVNIQTGMSLNLLRCM